ncbi:trypsin-like peptidase domain-containing protein [Ramlibacter sp. H39-3-26]|uniref:trypsin-like serine peptidase n=1 Tax=Curvibacter soli TaxID=3031331 RepID=UPI0023DA4E1F|nr:trypsin-like peptidase domain-containing protein [Ramlibacter sp. H39-3-26]MDF1484442.1 trypsin-like peptidase domain-containing protein [Ramlibacter sp. H39-3-26]
MKNLQEATERICEIKGGLVALDALIPALLEALPQTAHADLRRLFEAHAEAARTALLHAPISEHAIAAFERDVRRTNAVLDGIGSGSMPPQRAAVEAVLLTTTRVRTFDGLRAMTNASGFFFQRDERLYLVTSLHVLRDEASCHFPGRIEVELHDDAHDLTRCTSLSILLYRNGMPGWRQGGDSAGPVDVAVVEINREALPASCVLRAFTPAHLPLAGAEIEVGSSLAIVGFPLGFHDTVHHLPVVRQAAVASAFGIRFQGQGQFLTDARTHRGSSGAPVLLRDAGASAAGGDELPWKLLGVHSMRMDMSHRDLLRDESLGLNCAWYADILLALTEPAQAGIAA